MKLLYVVGAYGSRYIANEIHRELVQEFARRGHECIVYAGVTPGEIGEEPVSYRDGAVEVVRQVIDARGRDKVAAEIGRRALRYPRFGPLLRGLRRLLRQHPDIDVIHADAVYPIGAIVALAARGHRAAIVPSIHGGDLIDYPGYGYGRFRLPRRLSRFVFKRSALVRANSPQMAARAIALGCDPHKLRPILVNIGDQFFDESIPLVDRRKSARAFVAERHGFDPNAPLLLSTGRLLVLKGYHDVVAAMAIVARRRPDARLIIAGPNDVDPQQGDQRVALQNAILQHGVDAQVVLRDGLDYATEMPCYLAAADLLVAAAHIEGLNRVVAEAGTQGTPAIVSDMTPVGSLVRTLDAGAICPARDPQALAATIRRLIGDPRQIAIHAGNARRLAQHFRSVVIADQLLDLYADAIEQLTSKY